MARRGENIYKRKDGRYEARYIAGRRENGRARYRSVYAKTLREVRRKKYEGMRALEEGRDARELISATVQNVAGKWLKDESRNWKESTACRYKEKLQLYVIPEYGSRNITDISTDEIEAFIARLQTEGLNDRASISSGTAGLVLTVFKSLFRYARKKGFKVRFVEECVRVKRRRKPVTVLSERDENRLIAYLKKDTDETDMGVLTCLFTGMRIGELCALSFDDVDLDGCVIHVNKTMQRLSAEDGEHKTSIRIGSPKSDSSKRMIPFSPQLADIIRPFYKPGTFFLTGDREKFVEPRTMEERFARILDKCGLERVNFHVIRHTFATRCIERGMDTKTLSELLGHSSVATTLDRYVHLTMSHKAESVRLIEDLLQNSPS
ncbi:MAG: tyrosine-type recombinase/integrase [Lachnospiraceae bacterium]|nr:tyrosine-type recombinase/integrase [Lachnospiraceae bacterium]